MTLAALAAQIDRQLPYPLYHGRAAVECACCGWSNDGRLIVVDRYETDSPPGPRGKHPMIEFYADSCMDPDDRLLDCPSCSAPWDDATAVVPR